MTALATLDAAIRSPALRTVFSHWQAARGTRPLPAWRDIEPAAIGKYLAKIWAWRFDEARDSFVGRLAGEEIVAIMGCEMRGRLFADCFPTESADAVAAHFRRIVEGPSILHAAGQVYRLAAGSRARGERLVLPLADKGVLGITDYRLNLNEGSNVEGAVAAEAETFLYYPLG
jgi:hypothetical protein